MATFDLFCDDDWFGKDNPDYVQAREFSFFSPPDDDLESLTYTSEGDSDSATRISSDGETTATAHLAGQRGLTSSGATFNATSRPPHGEFTTSTSSSSWFSTTATAPFSNRQMHEAGPQQQQRPQGQNRPFGGRGRGNFNNGPFRRRDRDRGSSIGPFGPEHFRVTEAQIRTEIETQRNGVRWLDCPIPYSQDDHFWEGGLQTGPRPIKEDYSLFCATPILIDKIFELKSSFDHVSKEAFRVHREVVNPFDHLGRAFFNLRGAVKMANLDFLFDLLTTLLPPMAQQQQSHPNEPFRFADLCGGPGGFSEYILWKINRLRGAGEAGRRVSDGATGDAATTERPAHDKAPRARCFAMSLLTRDPSLTLQPTKISPRDMRQVLQHVGPQGDGDVTRQDNIDSFVRFVLNYGTSAGGGAGSATMAGASNVAPTNRPHELDDAAIRRYTKRVYVPMPCAQTRRDMFNKQFERQNHSFTEDEWNTIVAQTEGYSGSDIASLCREMAMQPIKEIRERILEVNVNEIRPMNLNDFTHSLQNIRPSISPDLLTTIERWNIAYGARA